MAYILLVDDTPSAIEPIAKYLEKSGHSVTRASNGREALSKVMNHLPDVIVLDLLMPEMDGPSFLEVVRSYVRLRGLPVVVLTGLAEDPIVERARAFHPNFILAKDKATMADIRQAVESAAARSVA